MKFTARTLVRLIFVMLLILPMCACSSAPGEYPVRNINGIIQWGAGGGTDRLMRPLCSLAEEKLGKNLVLQNMTGGAGSIATQYVYDAPADGYTLLLGAENPALYPALDILPLSYDDFECVFLIGDETVGIAVSPSSPFHSFTGLIDFALENPETLKLSTTGTGGLPWEMSAVIGYVTGASFKHIQYDSDATARTAVINGECDFTVCKVQSGIEEYRAGQLDYLCMFSTSAVPVMPEVPPVTDEYPGFAEFLPWGPFYGIFVKEGTDAAVTERLSAAFSEAFNDASYSALLDSLYVNPLGLTGERAEEYIRSWSDTMLTSLRKSGAVS